jgi:hypothetical protein
MIPIARTSTVMLTAAVLTVLLMSDATAQNGERTTSANTTFIRTWDVMPAEAQQLIEEGDLLVGERKYAQARKSYEAAAELIRGEGGFPALPLRRLARSYYYQGKYQTAVSLLDDLARESAAVGDIASQAWALADAAWVLGFDCKAHTRQERPGARLEMTERAQQIRMVLASPYLPTDVRSDITRTRCGGCHSAEKPPQWVRR